MKQALWSIAAVVIISMGCLAAASSSHSIKIHYEALNLLKAHRQFQTQVAQMRTPALATSPDKKMRAQ